MARIEAPVKMGGEVVGVGGLVFTDGVAETSDPAIIAYCTGAGYTVDGAVTPQVVEPVVDSRTVTPSVALGTPLRDAALEPRDGDFLVPTSAGQVDPHGPLAVSPEIHASQGVAPVVPGPVSGEADVQDDAEAAAVALAQTGGLVPPAGNAATAEWRTYAVARGMPEAEAAGHTRDELRAFYGH